MKIREIGMSNEGVWENFFGINDYTEKSVFKPENLIEIAIKQKGLQREKVPDVCILDPDGDIVRYLVKHGKAKKSKNWPCYHTDLYLFSIDGINFGIIGCAVGSPFAVLLAEELFTLGCKLLISMTSAGLIDTSIEIPCFMLIEKAVRGEGTSYYYANKSMCAELNTELKAKLDKLIQDKRLFNGITWTTDAPFRETQSKINYIKNLGAIAVEMESSALYSFAKSKKKDVICFAHITNQMGIRDNDFDKGNENNIEEAIKLIVDASKLVAKKIGDKK